MTAAGAGDLESLYPFLFGGAAAGSVMEEVIRSTEAKASETVELRRAVPERYATELAQTTLYHVLWTLTQQVLAP